MGIFDSVKKILGLDIKSSNGYNKITYPTGTWEEFYNKNGKKEGLSLSYYKSGQLATKDNYKNGEYHGPLKSYYKNGQLKHESTCKNGKREGEIKRYFKNGKIHEIQFYKNEEFISGETYYLDGSVIPFGVEVYSRMIDKEFRIFINRKLEGVGQEY